MAGLLLRNTTNRQVNDKIQSDLLHDIFTVYKQSSHVLQCMRSIALAAVGRSFIRFYNNVQCILSNKIAGVKMTVVTGLHACVQQ